jgi:cardiolipin synthase A/B
VHLRDLLKRRAAQLAIGLFGLAGCAVLPGIDAGGAMAASGEFHARPAQVVESFAGQVPRLEPEAAASGLLRRHLASEQALAVDSPLVPGNEVTLLQDGPDTYAAMFDAIRAAVDHINLETYIFDDGELGQQFAGLLLDMQAGGVQVNVLYDSVGGLMTPQAFFDRLREGGIAVLEFNPVNPLAKNPKTWRVNHRDHRKLLVIDGRVAFVGGVNISDSYSSSPSGKGAAGGKRPEAADEEDGWRDTHVQVEGPVVAEFQRLFLDTWTRQAGEPPVSRDYYPELLVEGEEIVRAIGSRADEEASPIYLTLLSAITRAEAEVHITVAYFGPDRTLLEALAGAAQRGVKVKLVLPSYTDSWAVFHLGRSHYTRLLRAGVEIHERHGAVMHAKSAVIDGVWSTIGSSNLDWRSFVHNDEVNAVVLSAAFAAQMDAMFAADVAESEQILLEEWKRRSWWMRIKERFARLGAYWL